MELDDVLNFIESRVRISRLHERIFRGCWNKQTYAEIAQEYKNSEMTVKHQAYLLWRSLSHEFGEKISKSNFRQVLSKHYKKSLIG